MTLNINIYEQIDKYLLDQFSQKELKEFEDKMHSDPELAKEVASQRELIELLDEHERIMNLKQRLDKIHDEIDIHKVKEQFLQLSSQIKRNRFIRFAATIAVAATISLIITLGVLYNPGWFNYGKHFKAYTELKNDIDDITSSQKSLWKALINSQKEKVKAAKRSGTSFAISANGYLVTSYHVVKGVDSIFVVHKIDTLIRYKTELIYKDISNDLAILKIQDTSFTTFGNLPYTFSNSFVELGEYVYTLGYSKEDIVFGEGSISCLTGYNNDTTAYQISIPLNPGNSGGPLMDAQGNLIGIICGKNLQKENVSFAIKSNYLLGIIDSIKTDSLSLPPELPRKNLLKWNKRTEQIKKLRAFIYKVEVYK